MAYRSLSRPSSAPDAKAFTLRSSSLELPLILSFGMFLPEFRDNFSVVLLSCHLCGKIVVYPFGKTYQLNYFIVLTDLSFLLKLSVRFFFSLFDFQ